MPKRRRWNKEQEREAAIQTLKSALTRVAMLQDDVDVTFVVLSEMLAEMCAWTMNLEQFDAFVKLFTGLVQKIWVDEAQEAHEAEGGVQ